MRRRLLGVGGRAGVYAEPRVVLAMARGNRTDRDRRTSHERQSCFDRAPDGREDAQANVRADTRHGRRSRDAKSHGAGTRRRELEGTLNHENHATARLDTQPAGRVGRPARSRIDAPSPRMSSQCSTECSP